jgi:hypothetical protein
MNDIVLVTPPAAEPVSLADIKLQLGFGPMQDSDRAASEILNQKLRDKMLAARKYCENYTNRVLVTQTWLIRLDGFPGHNFRYDGRMYPQIQLPKPPLQSVFFFKYVDTAGVVQDLAIDTTYGSSTIQYVYQLIRGSETQPARLLSGWARPWPPTRLVPGNVIVQIRCGYGGPITATTVANSTALTTPMKFNPDDAPLLVGDTGLPISIPGAGLAGTTLNTFVASVDPVTGAATLKDQAKVAVTNVQGWAGVPIPAEFTNAIKLMTEFYYGESQGNLNLDLKVAAEDELGGYRNLVS